MVCCCLQSSDISLLPSIDFGTKLEAVLLLVIENAEEQQEPEPPSQAI